MKLQVSWVLAAYLSVIRTALVVAGPKILADSKSVS